MAAIAPSGRAPGVNIDQSLPIQRSPGRPDDSLLCRRCTELLSFDKQMSMRPDCKWDANTLKFTWPVDDLQGLLASILANSAQGCQFCELLADEIHQCCGSMTLAPASGSPNATAGIAVTLDRKSNHPIHKVKICIQGKKARLYEDSRTTPYLEMSFDLRAVLADPTYQPYLDFQPEFDLHMASSENLNFARECLNRCVENHADCVSRNDQGCSQAASPQLLSQMPERPSRLLDLDRLHENSLELCNTAGIEDAKYAALSYCWGTGTRLVTTRQNIIRLSDGFSFDALPATIADAVIVTANLGIRYLWADSFCIIQDSDDDKNVELPRMADIYQNAHVTVIAASATSAFSGFLAPRKCPEVRVRAPIFDASKGIVGEVILRHRCDVRSLDDTPDATETRAWCLQEGILSTRCLVFSKLYPYWCCHEVPYARRGVIASASAELPLDLDDRRSPHYVQRLSDVFRSGRRGATLTEEDRTHVNTAWIRLVNQFSRREITDPMDKSRALAGLARAFHDTSQDRYLAGMWETTLLHHLNWVCLPDKDWPESPAFRVPLPAPSWSWLSAGPVSIPPVRNNHMAYTEPEIMRVDIHLTHPAEPFGHVANGALQLRGRLARILLWTESSPGDRSLRTNEMFASSIDDPIGKWSGYAQMDRPIHDGTRKPWHAYTLAQVAEVWALPLRQTPRATDEGPLPPSVEVKVHNLSSGMLLIRAPPSSGGAYMRVGQYSMDLNLDHVQPEIVTII